VFAKPVALALLTQNIGKTGKQPITKHNVL
jgi:hypothetical protein